MNGGTAVKRVRVVSRGAIAPDLPERINGCRESEISLASDQPVIRLYGVDGLNAQVAPLARGMQRESASVSLAKWCCLTRRVQTNVVCLTTHILRSAINRFFKNKPSFATALRTVPMNRCRVSPQTALAILAGIIALGSENFQRISIDEIRPQRC